MKDFNLCIEGKHTEKINSSLNKLENILHLFEENNTVLTTIISKYKILNSAPITDLKKSIETTLEKVGITTVDNKELNTVNSIYDRITKELNNPVLEYDTANNWLLYNGINSYLYDNNLNVAAPELRLEKDQKVFEYLLQASKDFNPVTIATSLELA